VASAADTASVAPSASAAPSATATAASAEPSPSASAAITPAATTDTLSFLPDPKNWAASLYIDAKDYPKVDGSTATLPLGVYVRSKLTGETLEQSDTFTRFTKTSGAWLNLAAKQTDLLIVYEAAQETKDQIKDAKFKSAPIGMDALVFLTNQGNPVNNLTKQQIVDIYTGKIKKWSEVGGDNTDIIAYQRSSESGSQALMQKLAMGKTKMADAPSVLKPAEMGELLDAVAQYDNTNNALGYSVYYYVKNMYQVSSIKLLSVDGVAPTSDSISAGQYAYCNPFYAVIREDEPADSNAHKLFDWLTGAEGDKAVVDAGYVAVKK
jgi:phosphate transport system substrate-binding protein